MGAVTISTRKARKLRAYVTRKINMKRELDAYLAESDAAKAASYARTAHRWMNS